MKQFSDAELNDLEYPDKTFGSIAAREIREECNKAQGQGHHYSNLPRTGRKVIYANIVSLQFPLKKRLQRNQKWPFQHRSRLGNQNFCFTLTAEKEILVHKLSIVSNDKHASRAKCRVAFRGNGGL
jgi:hypothetical protein